MRLPILFRELHERLPWDENSPDLSRTAEHWNLHFPNCAIAPSRYRRHSVLYERAASAWALSALGGLTPNAENSSDGNRLPTPSTISTAPGGAHSKQSGK